MLTEDHILGDSKKNSKTLITEQKQPENKKSDLVFSDFELKDEIKRAVSDAGFETPTEIQQKAIPLLLDGNIDFVGQAQTGTGKTAAFVLPLLNCISTKSKSVNAIILAPTRELANQVEIEIRRFSKYMNLKSLIICGGKGYDTQIRSLRKDHPQIVVGTPGRVIDLLKRNILDLNDCKNFILDEVDEMLKMGFLEDVKFLLEQTHKDKKVWMFSATLPKDIQRLINKELDNPVMVKLKRSDSHEKNIEQKYYVVKAFKRTEALFRLIEATDGFYGIVFCETKRETMETHTELAERGYAVESLHGDLRQAQREIALNKFKKRKVTILVCTDVAARGIDVTDLTHVVNMGLPRELESYVHRIGRTGRAGAQGLAVAIIQAREISKVKLLETKYSFKIQYSKLPSLDETKKFHVNNEIAQISRYLNKIVEKGDDFKIDALFGHFVEAFSEYTKDNILKALFVNNLEPALKQTNAGMDIEAPNDTRGISTRSSGGRGGRRGGSERRRGGRGSGSGGSGSRFSKGSRGTRDDRGAFRTRSRDDSGSSARGSRSRDDSRGSARGSRNRDENRGAPRFSFSGARSKDEKRPSADARVSRRDGRSTSKRTGFSVKPVRSSKGND